MGVGGGVCGANSPMRKGQGCVWISVKLGGFFIFFFRYFEIFGFPSLFFLFFFCVWWLSCAFSLFLGFGKFNFDFYY